MLRKVELGGLDLFRHQVATPVCEVTQEYIPSQRSSVRARDPVVHLVACHDLCSKAFEVVEVREPAKEIERHHGTLQERASLISQNCKSTKDFTRRNR